MKRGGGAAPACGESAKNTKMSFHEKSFHCQTRAARPMRRTGRAPHARARSRALSGALTRTRGRAACWTVLRTAQVDTNNRHAQVCVERTPWHGDAHKHVELQELVHRHSTSERAMAATARTPRATLGAAAVPCGWPSAAVHAELVSSSCPSCWGARGARNKNRRAGRRSPWAAASARSLRRGRARRASMRVGRLRVRLAGGGYRVLALVPL